MVTRVNGSVNPTAAKDYSQHRRRCRGARGVERVFSADGARTGLVGGLINTFHLNPRYSGFKTIGRGSFGVVCSAWDYRQARYMRSLAEGAERWASRWQPVYSARHLP